MTVKSLAIISSQIINFQKTKLYILFYYSRQRHAQEFFICEWNGGGGILLYT